MINLIFLRSPTLNPHQSVSLDMVIAGRGTDFGSWFWCSSSALSKSNPVSVICSSFFRFPWLFRNSSMESFHSRLIMFVFHGSVVSPSQPHSRTSPICSPTSKKFCPWAFTIRNRRSGFSSVSPLRISKKLVPALNSLLIIFSQLFSPKRKGSWPLWLICSKISLIIVLIAVDWYFFSALIMRYWR